MANKIKRPVRKSDRRRFLRSLALLGGVVGTSLLGFVPTVMGWFNRLRPPGALNEQKFLSACIKCGQCVQVCPVKAIKLADMMDGNGIGTPYIDSREQACDFSCDGLQCVLACPTGALTHEVNYSHQVDIGVARVVREKSCLAVHGKGFKGQARGADHKGLLRYDEVDRWSPILVSDHPYDLELCDLCVRQCPIEIRANQCDAGKPPSGDENQCPPKRAIRLVEISNEGGVKKMRPEILDGCVGCGVCEMICPVEPAVIVMESDPKRTGMRT
jgi:ferredoxin-type protein NapG